MDLLHAACTGRHLLAGVAVSQLFISCGPAYFAPPVTPELVKASQAPISEIKLGYTIHQAKCAKCHAFENPADYGAAELRDEIMPVMARKSKLSDADSAAVLSYLLAVRKISSSTP